MGLPCFDGKTPLGLYLPQVEVATLHNGWYQNEAGIHLTLTLKGEVPQVLADRLLNEHQDAKELIVLLWQRFDLSKPQAPATQ